MKVKVIATGNTAEYNDSYAARLIEQGEAVPAPPVADEADTAFPQRSKNRRESESPNGFSGTARREAVPAPPEEKKASSTVKEKTAKKG